ncbi:uncharacterized protein GGS22DRAFT_190966 [Annulohypoxylon maeteangense]|uniref:uncharacterized protein n=1 Tax=Annulohypoxylon maeteangense TaxID=1927788 RepID=UPI002008771E|nr:uncharacterized protein GGS22DRAFT_190966 [Annulohypoxylon maeteangense]KAI0882991.1 hypothetical protein GGS22DRAFT_190966 [Annulohypoxylon maeteangense]
MAVDQVLPHPSGLPHASLQEKEPITVLTHEIAMAPADSAGIFAHDGEHFFVQSPYTEREHLLDLRTLDVENALLARALAGMRCLRSDYATSPYAETFNWDEVIENLIQLVQQHEYRWKETSFFIVAFRSQIPPTTVYEDLGALDKVAHAEAVASGGFLKYWFGHPDKDGRNLATCLWRSQEDAIKGGVGPGHRKAAAATRSLYSHWKIDRHRLIIRDDVQSWEIIDWE